MKKIIVVLFILAAGSGVFAQAADNSLTGKWRVDPFLVEQEDGLLVVPEAVYSFPYTGITEMNFLDTGFVVFTIAGAEYRAFYETEVLDFDNLQINCMFKDGESFIVKLARAGRGWKFLYRISADSVLKGMTAEEDAGMQPDSNPAGAGMDLTAMTDMESEPAAESLYTGIIIRK